MHFALPATRRLAASAPAGKSWWLLAHALGILAGAGVAAWTIDEIAAHLTSSAAQKIREAFLGKREVLAREVATLQSRIIDLETEAIRLRDEVDLRQAEIAEIEVAADDVVAAAVPET